MQFYVLGEADFAPSKVTDNAITAVANKMKCGSVNVESSLTSGIG